jgi:hypothetical protein
MGAFHRVAGQLEGGRGRHVDRRPTGHACTTSRDASHSRASSAAQVSARTAPGDVSTLTTLSTTGYLQPCDVKGEITPHAPPTSDGRGDHPGRALRQLGEDVSEEVDLAVLEGRAGHDRRASSAEANYDAYDPTSTNKPVSVAAHRSNARWSISVKASRSALSTSKVPTTAPVAGSTTGTTASERVLENAVR